VIGWKCKRMIVSMSQNFDCAGKFPRTFEYEYALVRASLLGRAKQNLHRWRPSCRVCAGSGLRCS